MRKAWPILIVAGILAAADGAAAQDARGSRYPVTTGALPPAAALSPPAWSGKSGASGHPLMTAEAIRRVGRDFPLLHRAIVAAGGPAWHFANRIPDLHRFADS